MFFSGQLVDKPGSVVDDHLSSLAVAYQIKRISTYGRTALYVDLLAADRVYLLRTSPYVAVGSYPTPFTLTTKSGGFVSVALSLGSPPVAVSDCPSRCCPDFPLMTKIGHQ